jgi:polyferredoxin
MTRSSIRTFAHSVSWVLLPVFLIAGFLYPAIGILAVVCMSLPVIVAFFKGRIWCGHYCPRGSMLDFLFSSIKKKTSHLSAPYKKAVRYSVFVLLMVMFTVQLLLSESPADAGFVFVRMVFVTTAAALLLAAVFGRRTWCSVCPMGTLAGAASRMSRRKKVCRSERADEKAA